MVLCRTALCWMQISERMFCERARSQMMYGVSCGETPCISFLVGQGHPLFVAVLGGNESGFGVYEDSNFVSQDVRGLYIELFDRNLIQGLSKPRPLVTFWNMFVAWTGVGYRIGRRMYRRRIVLQHYLLYGERRICGLCATVVVLRCYILMVQSREGETTFFYS